MKTLQVKKIEYLHNLSNIEVIKLINDITDITYAMDESSIIAITDQKGVITYVNDTFCKISQYSRTELIGRSHRVINSEYHTDSFFYDMWASIKKGHVWKGEIRNKRKDGTFYWVATTIVPFLDSTQTPYQYVSVRYEITEKKELEFALRASEIKHRQLAFQDSLTKLPNTLFLRDKLKGKIESKEQFALLVLDIDRFKLINETYGHDVGNNLLLAIAQNLSLNILQNNSEVVISRNGGDEFFILKPFEQLEEIDYFAKSLIKAFEAPVILGKYKFFIEISVGIGLFPFNASDITTILRYSELAMYKAKENSGNSIEYFKPEQQEVVKQSVNLENDLRQALADDYFELYYQPIVDPYLNKIVSLEALIRLNHPVKGLISPMDFIPLAEKTGLIIPIGEWVLRQACNECKNIQIEYKTLVQVSVNISIKQLLNKDFLRLVERTLYEVNLKPQSLKIEITETMAMKQIDQIVDVINELKAIGVSTAIDDFGTGYSSLNYLKKLPIDIVKIDRSFIQDMLGSRVDSLLVESVISICHSIGMKVVAEGVETKEQLELLNQKKCDMVQGNFLGKPLPLQQIKCYLNSYLNSKYKGEEQHGSEILH